MAKGQGLIRAWAQIELEALGRSGLLWMPVLIGCGAGIYFSLRAEPPLAWALVGSLVLIGPFFRNWIWLRYTSLALGLIALGFSMAQLRAHRIGAPVIAAQKVVNIEGSIVKLDRSQSGRIRMTLDRLYLTGIEAAQTPQRVRVTFSGDERAWRPGERVLVKAMLSAPSGPVEPAGFDFRKYAWFRQLGGVGYALSPVIRSYHPKPATLADKIRQTRLALSRAIQDKIDGPAGGFAAAIFSGDRAPVDRTALAHLRASNLAHLLAISGLHMGLLTGFVFAGLRIFLVLIPSLALNLPTKKLAAIGAITAGAGYLVLSGATVSTQRAFIMVAVMFLATLVDRPAVTMRSIAVAALIVLAIRPESVSEPGFQMSFAATTALVFGFDKLRAWQTTPYGKMGPIRRFGRWAFGLFFASAVAGFATAPFAAFHFNQFSQMGLIANLAAVPLMGSIVMPAGVLAAIASIVGAQDIFLTIAGWGIEAIMFIAKTVAEFEHAVRMIPKTAPIWPILLTLGALLVILLKSRLQAGGMALVALALGCWGLAERPEILIDRDGKVWGVMTPTGRAVSHDRAHSFVVDSWLENDGDKAAQAQAFNRITPAKSGGATDVVTVAGKALNLVFVSDKADITTPLCAMGDIIFAPKTDITTTECPVIDKAALQAFGAFAVYEKQGVMRVESTVDRIGIRLWSPSPTGP